MYYDANIWWFRIPGHQVWLIVCFLVCFFSNEVKSCEPVVETLLANELDVNFESGDTASFPDIFPS